MSYVLFSCDFASELVERVDIRTLPANWRNSPIPPEAQAFGDEWLRSERSAVLEVPSAAMDHESNYLLNPSHDKFSEILISAPRGSVFDQRLVSR
jgi:RES domain-containing protein